jgi:hypothetical protein
VNLQTDLLKGCLFQKIIDLFHFLYVLIFLNFQINSDIMKEIKKTNTSKKGKDTQ